MARFSERAVALQLHMVSHNGDGGHGYDWAHRWGDGTFETVRALDVDVQVQNGDRDCSSNFVDVWRTILPGCTGNAVNTYTMREGCMSSGLWSWHPISEGFEPSPGDGCLFEGDPAQGTGHIAMYIGDGKIAHFRINEYGKVFGGKQGDQTGNESRIDDYQPWQWDGILHFEGDEDEISNESEDEMKEFIIWDGGKGPLFIREYPNGKKERIPITGGDKELEFVKRCHFAAFGGAIGQASMDDAEMRAYVSKYFKTV